MAKYRKKPVIIEAVQFKYTEYGDEKLLFSDLPDWLSEAFENNTVSGEFGTEDYWYCAINTLEGKMLASPDDYIIRGVNGELYPCKCDIFKKTYDEVE